MRSPALLLTSLHIATLATPALSESPIETQMAAAMKQYESKAEQARKLMRGAFDKYAQGLRQRGLDRELLASRLVAIADQRKAFEKDDALPTDEDLTPALFDYAVLMHQAQRPLVRAYDAA